MPDEHEKWCASWSDEPCDCAIYCRACGSCGDDDCCGPEGNGYKAICTNAPNCLYPKK